MKKTFALGSANVTTPELNVPKGNRHGPDSDYYFDYDFRLDPYEDAERLHTFIRNNPFLKRLAKKFFK